MSADLRLARPEEAHAIAALVGRAFALYVQGIGRDWPGPYGDMPDRIAEGRVRVIDDANGTPVAALLHNQSGAVFKIDMLAVEPAHQGQGLSRRLLAEAERLARRAKARDIQLHTVAKYDHLIRLYERAGFTLTHTGPRPKGSDGHDRAFFSKPLTNGGSDMGDYDLDRAYDINGAEDAKKLYDGWAATYDTSFGAACGYAAPRLIAQAFLDEGGAEATPVLDIGAGTGLVAESLPGLTVDAIDISQDMLDQAAAKGLYRNRLTANVLEPLQIPDATYGGFVSSGTFTHGHVGPGCLPELLRIARPGALFTCGVIAPVYDGMGFGSALARLVAAGTIGPLRFREIDIYDKDGHDHAQDKGLVMIFRKT